MYKLFTAPIVLCINHMILWIHQNGLNVDGTDTPWWEHDCFHNGEVAFCIISIIADLFDPKTKSFGPRKSVLAHIPY